MRFDYVEEDKLDSPTNVLLAEGKGSFFIKRAYDTDPNGRQLLTKAGDPKMDIMLVCEDCNGKQGNVFDTITAKTVWKIKGILDAIGKSHLYTRDGHLNPLELEGQSGYCELSIKRSPGYDDRTQVKKYLPAQANQPAPAVQQQSGIEDDSIPF